MNTQRWTRIFAGVAVGVVPFLSSPLHGGAPATERVVEILTQLEKRSEGLRDIRCQVQLVEQDKVNLSTNKKYGEILFLITKPNPHFLIHFDKTEMDGVLGKQEWYLFDGQWLFQVLERIRQVTRQEVARLGEKIDMFDLEKAPFPLPFGQKKSTILRNFDVTLVASSASDPPDTDHLVCITKPGSAMKRKYDKLEFFVQRDVHLPSRIVATKNGGLEVITANFPDLSNRSINTGVKASAFRRSRQWRGYEEIVEKLPE